MNLPKHPVWSYDAVLYEMNVRQITPEGTLKAATAHLQRLSNLGIDAVWLMPVYPIGKLDRKGSLGSYYSISDYCAVNPEFGTMEDFDAFVAEAHRLGLKVLLDWVANHTSRDARWLTEKPAEWYVRDENGEAKVPFDWDDTAQLNYECRDMWQGHIDAMKFWLTEHSVDGFRCDMAMLMPTEFWEVARRSLSLVKPDIFMLAEAEETDHMNAAFDACYSWELHHTMCDIAKGNCRVWELRNRIYDDLQRFPQWAMRMTFTSNHDENSWNGSEFERFGDAVKAMAALTFVLPGNLPLIYTGQEVGYDHSFAFFDKDPMPETKENEYTGLYRKLCTLRHENQALRSADIGGSFIEIDNNAPDCMLSFVRELEGNRVAVLMNLSPYRIFCDFHTGIYAGEYTDAISGEKSILHEHTWGDMEPWSYRILVK